MLLSLHAGQRAHRVNAQDLPVAIILSEIIEGGLIQYFLVMCIKAREVHFNQRRVIALAQYFDSFYCRVFPATFLQAVDIDDGYFPVVDKR